MVLEWLYENYNFLIPENEIMQLKEQELSELYGNDDLSFKFNVYFILLNEYDYLRNEGYLKESAHVCYLISYYIFQLLTPPCSEEIAMIYAQKALSNNDISKYRNWIEEVKRGN